MTPIIRMQHNCLFLYLAVVCNTTFGLEKMTKEGGEMMGIKTRNLNLIYIKLKCSSEPSSLCFTKISCIVFEISEDKSIIQFRNMIVKLRYSLIWFLSALIDHWDECLLPCDWVFWKMISIIPLFLNIHFALQHQWVWFHWPKSSALEDVL